MMLHARNGILGLKSLPRFLKKCGVIHMAKRFSSDLIWPQYLSPKPSTFLEHAFFGIVQLGFNVAGLKQVSFSLFVQHLQSQMSAMSSLLLMMKYAHLLDLLVDSFFFLRLFTLCLSSLCRSSFYNFHFLLILSPFVTQMKVQYFLMIDCIVSILTENHLEIFLYPLPDT